MPDISKDYFIVRNTNFLTLSYSSTERTIAEEVVDGRNARWSTLVTSMHLDRIPRCQNREEAVGAFNRLIAAEVQREQGLTIAGFGEPDPPLSATEILRRQSDTNFTATESGWIATSVDNTSFTPSLSVAYPRDRSARYAHERGNDEEEEPFQVPVKKKKPERFSHLWALYDKIAAYHDTIGTIYDKTGYQKAAKEDIIGVEFENELTGSSDAPHHAAFRLTNDNSLRNQGIEYVLKHPSSISKVKKLNKELLEKLAKVGCNNTTRASTHIHFDVTQMTYSQLYSFVCCYFFCEELLSHFCGVERQNNLFCLRLVDSKRIAIELAQEMLSKDPFSSRIFNENHRYAAVNFSAISKFGSLEFRMFPAVSDTPDLELWIDCLNNLRLFSLGFPNLTKLKDYFIKEDAADVLAVMLGKKELDDLLTKLKRKPSDKEMLGWCRNAFCFISPILEAGKDFPSEEELKNAKSAAEEHEKILSEERKKKEAEIAAKKKLKTFVYPSWDHVEDVEQIEQATAETLATINEEQIWSDE